jgi:HNH endonuclease
MWRLPEDTKAAHIFPYMHGQAAMNAIFGKMQQDELFSARNGLIVSNEVETYFDSGKLVIVPDISSPSKPKWLGRQPRRFKLRVIDQN